MAAAVVLWWAPTPAMRNPVTAIVLVVLVAAGFEGLRRAAREFPQADRREFQQRTRERLARSYERVRERIASGGAAVARRASTLRLAAGEGQTAPPVPDTRVDQLERLARLRDTGAMDEQEFRAEKPRILGGTAHPRDRSSPVAAAEARSR